MKKSFAIIGHPIAHTISPFIHKRLFDIAGITASYNIIDVGSEDLHYLIPNLRQLNGYNITIPHKQNIIQFLDFLRDKAKVYNSVNTVKNSEISEGFNTDADGFLNALENENIPLSGNIYILGCGGVARTIAFESIDKGCNVTLAVRNCSFNKAEKLVNEIKKYNKKAQISIDIMGSPFKCPVDILINSTPVGMYPDINNTPIDKNLLKSCKVVFDAIYNPFETDLIKMAKSNGSRALGGLSMLVWQAVIAHKIWDDSIYSINDIKQLIEDSKNELKSLRYML